MYNFSDDNMLATSAQNVRTLISVLEFDQIDQFEQTKWLSIWANYVSKKKPITLKIFNYPQNNGSSNYNYKFL